jgi:hypothetical protein
VSDETPTDESATPAAPAYVVPDRADAPVSEVTERFLRAIIAQVPADRIEELHLFSPLRQGTVETGIAVLATRVEVPVDVPLEVPMPVDADAPEFLLDETAIEIDTDLDSDLDVDGAVDAAVDVVVDVEVDALVDAMVDADVDVDVDAAVDVAVAVEMDAETVDDDVVDAEDVVITDLQGAIDVEVLEGEPLELTADDVGDDEITILDASGVVHAEAIIADDGSDDESLEDLVPADEPLLAAEVTVETAPVRAVRHTVYTARYRYVIKGPERGKWEASVKAEAEAPLITVETVVRGVQRRAGEETEIVRFSGAQIACALRLPSV